MDLPQRNLSGRKPLPPNADDSDKATSDRFARLMSGLSLAKDFFGRKPLQSGYTVLLSCVAPLLGGFGILLLIPLLSAIGISTDVESSSSINRFLSGLLAVVGVEPSVGGILCVFVLVAAAAAGLQFCEAVQQSRLKVDFLVEQQKQLNAAISRTDWPVLQQLRVNELAHALSVEADRLLKGLQAFLAIVSGALTVAFYTIISLWIAPAITASAVVSGFTLMLLLYPSIRVARSSGSSLTFHSRQFYSQVLEHLAGLKETRSMNGEARHRQDFEELTDRIGKVRFQFDRAKAAATFLFSTGICVTMSLMVYGAILAFRTSAGDLALMIIIFSRISPRILRMQNALQDFQNAFPAYEAMLEARRLCCQQNVVPIASSESTSAFCTNSGGTLDLESVGYRYQGNTQWALRDVSIRFPPCSVTTIVGASGAGKSTLANLLLGLLQPSKGQISLNGRKIHENIHEFRDCVGYVPQETWLRDVSVRENLRWARPDATESEMWQAIRQACATEVIASLPLGLDTVVGHRGDRLSGGQKQRIAIARALLRQPRILILDEATSALDAANQHSIRETLQQLSTRITVIEIAHTRSALEFSDHVVVLRDGAIITQGDVESVEQSGQLRGVTDVGSADRSVRIAS